MEFCFFRLYPNKIIFSGTFRGWIINIQRGKSLRESGGDWIDSLLASREGRYDLLSAQTSALRVALIPAWLLYRQVRMQWQAIQTNTSDPRIWKSWEMILCLLKDTWASAWEHAPPGTVFAVSHVRVSPQEQVFSNQACSSTQHWSLFWSEVERVYFLWSICSLQFYFMFFIHVGFLWQWYTKLNYSLFLVSARALNISKVPLC